MGCGSIHSYSADDINRYIRKGQQHSFGPELVDGKIIKLTSSDGFFNGSPPLDITWLRSRMTKDEYVEAIKHINQRVSQAMIGASKRIPIHEIPVTQTTKLAVDELNDRYVDRIHFSFEHHEQLTSREVGTSFLFIDIK